ncbi:MAG: hypothetical protein IIW73_08225, partial [Clostridia bacterium]|nr:hypothetical protein [Clostridia bacterium]
MQMIKKTISILLTVVMLVSMFSMVNVASAAAWDGTVATSFAGGTGTENDPYIIMNASQLAYMRDCVNNNNATYGAAYYKLGADIVINENVLNADYYINSGTFKSFGSIGASAGAPFNGTFDGDGYTISGYYARGDAIAFFLFAGGVFKNFTMKDCYKRGSADANAILIEKTVGQVTIQNVVIDGNLSYSSNQKHAGMFIGVVSNNVGGVTIEDCVAKGLLYSEKGNGHLAGFIGASMDRWGNITIKNCINYANTSPLKSVPVAGGFIADLADCAFDAQIVFEDCINYGNLTASTNAGGFVGEAAEVCNTTFVRCLNEGSISGATNSGGFVGYYAQASKNGQPYVFSIANSFNVGTVTGAGAVGAFVGADNGAASWTVTDSYYLEDSAASVGSASATTSDTAALQEGRWLGPDAGLWLIKQGENPTLRLSTGEIVGGDTHTHDYKVTKNESTCTDGGSIVYTCECGEVYTVEGKPLGHDYSGAQTTDPTCNNVGEMTYTCSRCDDSYTVEIEALGHDYVGVPTIIPTCKDGGEMTYTCSGCGDSYTEELAIADHSYIEGYCEFCGIREVYTPNGAEWTMDFVDADEKAIDTISTTGGEFWMVVRLTNYADYIGEMVNTGDMLTSTYDRTIAVATSIISMDNSELVAVRENNKIVYSTPYASATLISNYDTNDGLLKVVFSSDNNAGCTFSIGRSELDANDGEIFRIKVKSKLTEAGKIDVKFAGETGVVATAVALVNKPEAGEWITSNVYSEYLPVDARCYDTIY